MKWANLKCLRVGFGWHRRGMPLGSTTELVDKSTVSVLMEAYPTLPERRCASLSQSKVI